MSALCARRVSLPKKTRMEDWRCLESHPLQLTISKSVVRVGSCGAGLFGLELGRVIIASGRYIGSLIKLLPVEFLSTWFDNPSSFTREPSRTDFCEPEHTTPYRRASCEKLVVSQQRIIEGTEPRMKSPGGGSTMSTGESSLVWPPTRKLVSRPRLLVLPDGTECME